MEPVLTVRNLRKTFTTREKAPDSRRASRVIADFFSPPRRTVQAVDDVSFTVERGELLAFIGPNGAGKSTTIKCMTGILTPTGGTITVLGLDPQRKRRALAYRIGTVFGQKSQLWFHLPALDSLRLLGDIYDIDRREARRGRADDRARPDGAADRARPDPPHQRGEAHHHLPHQPRRR